MKVFTGSPFGDSFCVTDYAMPDRGGDSLWSGSVLVLGSRDRAKSDRDGIPRSILRLVDVPDFSNKWQL